MMFFLYNMCFYSNKKMRRVPRIFEGKIYNASINVFQLFMDNTRWLKILANNRTQRIYCYNIRINVHLLFLFLLHVNRFKLLFWECVTLLTDIYEDQYILRSQTWKFFLSRARCRSWYFNLSWRVVVNQSSQVISRLIDRLSHYRKYRWDSRALAVARGKL